MQISQEHLDFLDMARGAFASDPLLETFMHKPYSLIALRYGTDRDCIRILELGDEVAFFKQMIPVCRLAHQVLGKEG